MQYMIKPGTGPVLKARHQSLEKFLPERLPSRLVIGLCIEDAPVSWA